MNHDRFKVASAYIIEQWISSPRVIDSDNVHADNCTLIKEALEAARRGDMLRFEDTLKRLSESGYIYAHFLLGHQYFIRRDNSQAIVRFSRSLSSDNPSSYFWLAKLLFTIDSRTSSDNLEKAAKHGHIIAKQFIVNRMYIAGKIGFGQKFLSSIKNRILIMIALGKDRIDISM
jgi:TPR repeat protein